MSRNGNYPLRGKRFLSKRVTDSLITTVLGPEFKGPICRELATTHAAGSILASFAVHTMRANFVFLGNQVDVASEELRREQDFTLDKLKEHLEMMTALHFAFSILCGGRFPTSSEEHNMTFEVLRHMPTNGSPNYAKELISCRNALERIINDTVSLMEEEWASGEEPEQYEVERLLESSHRRMHMIRRRLQKLEESMDHMASQIRRDWHRDLHQIRDAGLCVPVSSNNS